MKDDDEFVVVACDGIWDFLSSEDIVSFIVQKLSEDANRNNIPHLVIQEALSRGAFDNLTVSIMWLK